MSHREVAPDGFKLDEALFSIILMKSALIAYFMRIA
jgi:hypothetical protein